MGSVVWLAGGLLSGMIAAAATPAAAHPPATEAARLIAPADTPRSVLAGVYTALQAEEGQALFRESCGNCHATAQFRGSTFQDRWHGQSVFMIYDQLRMMMPMDNPGGLAAAEYAAVIAYILELNGYPSDSVALPAADSALKQVLFERRPASR